MNPCSYVHDYIIMLCFVTGPVRSNSSIFAPLLPRVSSMQNTKPSRSWCRFRGGKGNLYTRDLDGFIFSAIRWCQRKIGEETSSSSQSGRFLTAKALMQFIAIAWKKSIYINKNFDLFNKRKEQKKAVTSWRIAVENVVYRQYRETTHSLLWLSKIGSLSQFYWEMFTGLSCLCPISYIVKSIYM